MTNEKKEGSFMTLFVVMTISLLIAFLWNQIPIVKNTVNLVLSPTAGWLLSYNINWGMILIVFFITLFTTLIQKYATDQETLKEIKEEVNFELVNSRLMSINSTLITLKRKTYHLLRIILKATWKGTLALSEEHEDHKWVSIEKAIRMPHLVNGTKEILKSIKKSTDKKHET